MTRGLVGTCLLLSACSGNGANVVNSGDSAAYPAASVPEGIPTQSAAAHGMLGPVTVNVTYVLPNAPSTPSPAVQRVAQRRLQYISTSNTTITIVVTPLGGSGTAFGPSACTTATCAVSFTANPGPNTLAFTLKDGGGNTLSSFSTIQIVQPVATTTLTFTANPVVDHVALVLASATEPGGTAINDPVTINAYDKDNNIIVGPANYVDANGNAVVLTLGVRNSQVGGTGTVSIQGSARITAPGQTATYARYDGRWLDHADLSVSSSIPIAGSSVGATLTTIPTATEYTSGITGGAQPGSITSGRDGNLWFTECDVNCGGTANAIGRITQGGVITEFSAGMSGGPSNATIASGIDGNLWFTEHDSNKIGRITTTGVITEFSTGITGGAQPNGITAGPDGNIWFTEISGNRIGRITTTGVITEFSTGMTGGAQPNAITTGPAGNLWFTESAGNRIGRITPTGGITEFSTGITAGSQPQAIASGPDGNLWFVEYSGNRIGRITTSGVVTEFSSGITGGAAPLSITSGPDGNLWFTEFGLNRIGRITTSGVVTEFSSGITGGAGPYSITSGLDGNIWFTEFNGTRIGRLIL